MTLHAMPQVQAPFPKVPRPIIVVGAGSIVRDAHLPAYAKAKLPVQGIYDLSSDRAQTLAEQFGVRRVYSTLDEALLDAGKDTVFDVAVPANAQLSVLPYLPKGAAVLLQKPMGETLAEAKEVLRICRERGLSAAVNFQLRFAPKLLAARAPADAGMLGEVHDMEVRVSVLQPWHMWAFLAKAPRVEILYHSIHYIDLVRSWFGTPQSVYAKTTVSPMAPSLAATRSVVIFDYGERRRVFLHSNHGHDFSPDSQASLVQWEGTSGAMQAQMGVNLDYPRGKPDTLRMIRRGDESWTDLPVHGNWFPDAFVGSMGSLQAFVEGSAQTLPTSVEDAIDTMRTVEAAYRSSERGGTVLPE